MRNRAFRMMLALASIAAAAVWPARSSAAELAPRTSKKLIEAGWDMPTTAYLRENWERIDQGTPFDGLAYEVTAGEPGGSLSTKRFWSPTPWQREQFEPALADLRACRFTTLRHNFLRVDSTPGTVDWFDEAGWGALLNKAAIVGWLVRESGSEGMMLDLETYGADVFRYDPSSGRSFDEVCEMARRRGGQFISAFAKECPNATVLAFWLMSMHVATCEAPDPRSALMTHRYGLQPAFINGLLDALPPTMTLVDGCENAYDYDGADDYLRAYVRVRQMGGPTARLVAPENRRKYEAQVQVSYGVYLDTYVNPVGSDWYIGGHGGTRVDRLRHNLSIACQTADEYVWVYGEQARWWGMPYWEWAQNAVKDTVGKGRLWEEVLPGLTNAILWAKDPTSAARRAVEERRRSGTLTNLAPNPGFEGGVNDDGIPEGYGAWQSADSKGRFSADRTTGMGGPSSYRLDNVTDGCGLLRIPVEPGRCYAVGARMRSAGKARASVVVRWQTERQRFLLEDRDVYLPTEPIGAEWERAFGLVAAPAEAADMIVLLQSEGEGTAWFDDVEVYAF